MSISEKIQSLGDEKLLKLKQEIAAELAVKWTVFKQDGNEISSLSNVWADSEKKDVFGSWQEYYYYIQKNGVVGYTVNDNGETEFLDSNYNYECTEIGISGMITNLYHAGVEAINLYLKNPDELSIQDGINMDFFLEGMANVILKTMYEDWESPDWNTFDIGQLFLKDEESDEIVSVLDFNPHVNSSEELIRTLIQSNNIPSLFKKGNDGQYNQYSASDEVLDFYTVFTNMNDISCEALRNFEKGVKLDCLLINNIQDDSDKPINKKRTRRFGI